MLDSIQNSQSEKNGKEYTTVLRTFFFFDHGEEKRSVGLFQNYLSFFLCMAGVAGLYDYGPSGCAMEANMINIWKSHFVLEEQMLEIRASLLTPHSVLK